MSAENSPETPGGGGIQAGDPLKGLGAGIVTDVAASIEEAETIRREWPQGAGNLPLVIIESPYRLLLPPLLAYVDALRETHPDDILVVVLPEFVPRFWWDNLLHNQTALRLKAALLFRPGVVVASYPYHLG